MTKIALIDADEQAYKIALKYQNSYYGVYRDDKLLWTHKYKQDAIESIENADDLEIKNEVEIYETTGFEGYVNDVIDSILTNSRCDEFRLLLSGENNFRYKRATLLPYKGNRSEEKPVHLTTIRNHLIERGAIWQDELEADDLLASYACSYKDAVICSSDKDLKTVPSWNYSPLTQSLCYISPIEANYNFFYQLLIGDTIDNIPSPYRLGKETATNFLKDFMHLNYTSIGSEEWYQNIFIPFYSKFLLSKDKKTGEYKTKWYSSQPVEEVLLEIGDLLWMRRTFDPNEKWRDYFNG